MLGCACSVRYESRSVHHIDLKSQIRSIASFSGSEMRSQVSTTLGFLLFNEGVASIIFRKGDHFPGERRAIVFVAETVRWPIEELPVTGTELFSIYQMKIFPLQKSGFQLKNRSLDILKQGSQTFGTVNFVNRIVFQDFVGISRILSINRLRNILHPCFVFYERLMDSFFAPAFPRSCT